MPCSRSPRERRCHIPAPIAAPAVLAAARFWTSISSVRLFWAASILTRPLGVTVGDLLDKPRRHGGLALSRPIASAVIALFILFILFIVAFIWHLPQRAVSRRGSAARANRGMSCCLPRSCGHGV